VDRLEVLDLLDIPGSREARETLQLNVCPESADVIDALAAIADPNGAAAERVRMCDPLYMIEYLDKKLIGAFAVPKEFLGTP